MIRVIEYFAKSLKVIRNDTVELGVCKCLPVKLCLWHVPSLIYAALKMA